MNNTFMDTSREIANSFLQSIVFIDDRAYTTSEDGDQESKNHDFDASEISRAFAKSKKICAVYQPKTLEDISDLSALAQKSDITVIDWQINIREKINAANKEEDADEEDPRGPHTRRIIKDILADPLTGKGSLKLILVYTGELRLNDITQEIYDDLKRQNIEGIEMGDCKVFTQNIKILVVAKPSPDGEEIKFKHNPDLNQKVVKYENLPDFILKEFSEMTSGLLSNFVLQALTILRKNTFRLIKLYNNKLDPSFLHHRLLLPNQDDSKEQLIEILSDSVQALLNYNEVGNCISADQIKSWIAQNSFNGKIKEVPIDNNFINEWVTEGMEKAVDSYWSSNKSGAMSKTFLSDFEKAAAKSSTFLVNGNDSYKEDCEFSILTHHKSNLKQPSSIPKLSLGTVVKQEGKGYFLCIQAKCDSNRVKSERKFLFLPLNQVTDGKKFNLVIEELSSYAQLQIEKSPYEIRTVKFTPNGNDESINAVKNGDEFFFTSSHNEKLTWVCDLKDGHAQRASNTYASQLSRVGLDESEWLRRWSGN